jgi:TolB protein
VNGGDARALLSDGVNDSFVALRDRVLEETGWDYMSILGSAWRSIDHTPRPGQSRRSWHVCGRAFDINQGFYDQDDQLIQLIREDVGNETYWRVLITAAEQDGSMGEPLRVAPWDLKAREGGGSAAVQGGELLEEVPSGYYVDFTNLAVDYGWERSSALYRWRYYWPDIEWWHFQKTDGMNWWDCMLELYEAEEIEAAFGPIPGEIGEGVEE